MLLLVIFLEFFSTDMFFVIVLEVVLKVLHIFLGVYGERSFAVGLLLKKVFL